ncbi:MAG: Phage virion morphosis family [Bacteroidota bacterium]|jgi:phage gpG-like protein
MIRRTKGDILGDLQQKATAFAQLQRILPVLLGNEAENHFKQGFERGGGMTDAGSWKPRKRQERARGIGNYRAILVQSGILKRDIKRRQTSWKRTVVSTSALTEDYASVHNQGLRSGRGAGFVMPKREFIGKSSRLVSKHKLLIQKELKKL